jgi:hypothetical protein
VGWPLGIEIVPFLMQAESRQLILASKYTKQQNALACPLLLCGVHGSCPQVAVELGLEPQLIGQTLRDAHCALIICIEQSLHTLRANNAVMEGHPLAAMESGDCSAQESAECAKHALLMEQCLGHVSLYAGIGISKLLGIAALWTAAVGEGVLGTFSRLNKAQCSGRHRQ